MDNGTYTLSDHEFTLFQRLLQTLAGVYLPPGKQSLLLSRLSRRLLHYQLPSFSAYYRLVTDPQHRTELQHMVDLLTTHETYFFREPAHFDFLRDYFQHSAPQQLFRVWSAACSSGEEVYSIAMTLADCRPHGQWEVVGSDISVKEIEKARRGHYQMERIDGIPNGYLQRFCLKGVRQQSGSFLIQAALRKRTQFRQINLLSPLPNDLGLFDLIFLRNVMIYFETATKQKVIDQLTRTLQPGGYLVIGHSETLNGLQHSLEAVRPTLYRRPLRA